MAITARLSRTLHQALGDDAAADLVTWMELVESNRIAFREAFDAFGARIEARMDTRFAEAILAFENRFRVERIAADERFAKVDERFAKVDERFAKLDERLGRLEATMERRFADLLKWSFVFWVGAVGAVAALAGVLR